MDIKTYIKDQVLLMDGAMGTYYAELTGGHYTLSEPANLTHPNLILEIHKAYIEAGAKLIRTNTFSANPYTLFRSMTETRRLIIAGIDLAYQAVKGTDCGVAYSIGPIPEPFDVDASVILEAYHNMIDVGLDRGVQIILFETFSRVDLIKQLVDYVRSKDKKVQVMTHFSLNQHGYTKVGVNREKILEQIGKDQGVTTYGFNCGVGVSHLLKLIKTMDFDPSMMAAVPNAGYPDQQLERTVYQNNSDFFADAMLGICEEGVRIIGGCCGTTPEHIRKLRDKLERFDLSQVTRTYKEAVVQKKAEPIPNSFKDKLCRGEFVIAVELDPPFKPDLDSLMAGAHALQDVGVDLITIADSPLGRARADSLMMAAKLKASLGVEVLPHISMRDKNLIALRAGLLGAYFSDLRNILVVTGDPIPSDDRDEIKSVFNMNAIGFIRYVTELNEMFGDDGFFIGGALNPYAKNIDVTIERVRKKQKSGVKFLLSQPVYNDEGIENIRKIKEATGVYILGGIMPLVSLRNARFLHYEFPGINIPEGVMARFTEDMTRDESEAVGVELAVDLARRMAPIVDGHYFMTPFNRGTMIAKIIRQLNQ